MAPLYLMFPHPLSTLVLQQVFFNQTVNLLLYLFSITLSNCIINLPHTNILTLIRITPPSKNVWPVFMMNLFQNLINHPSNQTWTITGLQSRRTIVIDSHLACISPNSMHSRCLVYWDIQRIFITSTDLHVIHWRLWLPLMTPSFASYLTPVEKFFKGLWLHGDGPPLIIDRWGESRDQWHLGTVPYLPVLGEPVNIWIFLAVEQDEDRRLRIWRTV